MILAAPGKTRRFMKGNVLISIACKWSKFGGFIVWSGSTFGNRIRRYGLRNWWNHNFGSTRGKFVDIGECFDLLLSTYKTITLFIHWMIFWKHSWKLARAILFKGRVQRGSLSPAPTDGSCTSGSLDFQIGLIAAFKAERDRLLLMAG